MTGIEPRLQRWEARVLPLCHLSIFRNFTKILLLRSRIGLYLLGFGYLLKVGQFCKGSGGGRGVVWLSLRFLMTLGLVPWAAHIFKKKFQSLAPRGSLTIYKTVHKSLCFLSPPPPPTHTHTHTHKHKPLGVTQ